MSEPSAAAVVLPGPVRDRVLGLAADTLAALPPADVPPRLQAVARFTPRQRLRRGAASLSAVLDTDGTFRARVAELARAAEPDLSAALADGRVPPAADPVQVAAFAYVLGAPDWEQHVEAAARELAAGQAPGQDRTDQELARLREQLEATRAQGRQALAAAREETRAAQAELRAQRRAVADARRATAAAQAARDQATGAAVDVAAEADRRVTAAESEARRMRDRLAEVEHALEVARRSARAGRSAEDVRLRLLLDTLVESATGLRRELALPPVPRGERPADMVADTVAEAGTDTDGAPGPRRHALRVDDPAVLDGLLALPQAHLVVDGYNVTKTGYGSLPLETQRQRLLTGLAALAARTAAEVTCVFDGADLDQPVQVVQPRGVRVIFSPAGTTADQVVRRLVRAEPEGRPIIVVSSDREVVDGVVAAGAHAVPSTALLRRLDRG